MKKKTLVGVLAIFMSLSMPVQAQEIQPKTIELSYEEAQELMQIAWCEAGNQGPSGQALVMSVVLNRVQSPEWPDDIHSVIWQPHQFSTSRMSEAEINADTHMALAEIEMGNITPEIIAFETTSSNFLDRYFSLAFTYRDHQFYTKKID